MSPELETPQVIIDDYSGAFQAVEHLIDQGYRRIAHLAGPTILSIARYRLQGYLDAMQKHNLPIEEGLVVHHDLTEESARECARQLLDLPNPPEAIFAVNDPSALEVFLLAKQRKIKVPQDLGIVGFSNDPVSALIEPALTTVEQPVWEIGEQSAQLLLEQLEQPSLEKRVLKTRLIVRDSSRRRGWKGHYHQRNLAETAIFRFKTIHGLSFFYRKFEAQQKETDMKIRTLDIMTVLDMPILVLRIIKP